MWQQIRFCGFKREAFLVGRGQCVCYQNRLLYADWAISKVGLSPIEVYCGQIHTKLIAQELIVSAI